ncbi:hypothetical protein Q9L42_007025 [Methylomarinum sp. Ch1-1]|uniref:BT1 family protein n=1 Tax=Methylomarinum roseum TaxID=3067653 RepID=A0AAU7NY29_9GAMM|nr:hypothetical protein [Methylomarinum sp. Ch1-1]MDP4522034.1 hypothetical protein [Methylomarinum sp. Ch1-1]
MFGQKNALGKDKLSAAGLALQWRSWLDRNIFDLGRQMRLSYLPPLMVYLAAGISGLTAIVGTFFVKEYLGLSAEFLASLSFWAMLPWSLKMPLGHLVDLLWQYKHRLIYLGALLIAASLLIMSNLLSDPGYMEGIMPAENWYVLAALLAPVGYVMQDTVADAMTVEAVPRFDEQGRPIPQQQIMLAHTTMQTLGRVAIIGGSMLVAAVNVQLFSGVATMNAAEKARIYLSVYHWALWIPVVSVLGVALASYLRRQQACRLAARGYEFEDIEAILGRPQEQETEINWWILGGGLGFVLFAVTMGVVDIAHNEEIVFVGSLAIVVFLIWRLTRELGRRARNQLYATALVIFAFRSVPTTGAGETWWMIDELDFDQQFLSKLSLLTSSLTLLGMFLFRRFMAERPITYIIAVLTIALSLLYLPNLGLYYGLHEWTAAHTGGVVDARFIALFDTALESPLGQIAMIPMLAWIANSAPEHLKATYFAVMAAFVNLALSLSQLITKLLNQLFLVTREVSDAATGVVTIPADYSQLGSLLFFVMLISFAMPMLVIVIAGRVFLTER